MIRNRILYSVVFLLLHLVASGQPAEYRAWSPSQLHNYAVDLLKRGRTYSAAIEALRLATEREPDNLDYQLALGHAYAARFASIAFARYKVEWEKREQGYYEKRVLAWERTHDKPGLPLFNTPPPPEPASAATPDDRKPYSLTKDEGRKELESLARRSISAYRRVEELARKAPAERRASADYERAWGLFLLRHLGKDVIGNPLPVRADGIEGNDSKGSTIRLGQDEIVVAFRACTGYDPNIPEYWQSLGLALAPGVFEDEYSQIIDALENSRPLNQEGRIDKAVDAFKHALELKPRNPELLYAFASICMSTKPSVAAEHLEKMVKRRGENSVAWYLLADLRFRNAETLKGEEASKEQNRAVAALAYGNRAPAYRAIPLSLPVPESLKHAWGYRRAYGPGIDNLVLLFLFSQLSDLGKHRLQEKDLDSVFRIGLLEIALGRKTAPQFAATDLDPADPQTLFRLWARGFHGTLIWERGFGFFKDAQKQHPSEYGARLVNEYTADFERAHQWEQAIIGP